MALVIPLSRKQKLHIKIDKELLLDKLKKKFPGKIINHAGSVEPHFVNWDDLCETLNELEVELISQFNTEVILIADRVVTFSKSSRYNSSSGL